MNQNLDMSFYESVILLAKLHALHMETNNVSVCLLLDYSRILTKFSIFIYEVSASISQELDINPLVPPLPPTNLLWTPISKIILGYRMDRN